MQVSRAHYEDSAKRAAISVRSAMGRAMLRAALVATCFVAASLAFGQTRYSTTSLTLADSDWPIFHANTRATASSPDRGPGPVSRAASVAAQTAKRLKRRPNVSPWTVLAAPYADGSQAVLTTPNDGVAKYVLAEGELRAVDFLPLERRFLDFDWGIVLLSNGLAVVTEQKQDRFLLIGDAQPGPNAPLAIKAAIPIDRERYGQLSAHFTLAPDGHLIALTAANRLIAVDLERRVVVATFELPSDNGTTFHNSFPIDAAGRLYLSTQTQMAAIDWTGHEFVPAWMSTYDMRGPGCERSDPAPSKREEVIAVARGKTCTGSGTTPTLLGSQDDGVVVIVDGHAPQNNLVAFWRGTPPRDWTALADPNKPGARLDRRVAGFMPLPHSSPVGDGFTAENSPAALGFGVVVAQWAGFRPGRKAPRGVQRVDWQPDERRLQLIWANPDVHFNGVPTIACSAPADCHAYGMGRYGARYRYTSVDFATGAETGSIDLGRSDKVLDQGNNHAVAADGSIIYAGRSRLVNVR